jgi:hypothetical protein
VVVWALIVLITSATAAASVTVSPSSAQLKPGGQLQFTAAGVANGLVVWNATGAGCIGSTCGQITSSGLYTAPSTAPSPATVIVSATSIFDASQVGTATVTLGAPTSVSVSVSPGSVTLAVKGQQQFTASVTGTSNTSVTWTVTGIGCVAGSCGTITSTGLYSAPASIPSPALATVTATSAADFTKSASASVVIQSAASVSVTVTPATAQVSTGAQQQFSAKVNGATNTAVTWRVSGAGCSGSTCGTISGTGLYTAPASLPSPAAVTVTATSVADPAQSGSGTVTIVAVPGLTISPVNPQVKPQGQIQFSATGTGSNIVVWNVTGAGCSGITCGSISSAGLYTAPSTIPSPNSVTVTATSVSNAAITGSTTATIVSSNISVGISPTDVSIGVGGQQQFTSKVTGSSNTAVTWSLSGTGCVGSLCGAISATGLYTAPSTAPNPPFITVTATSVADPSKSASASVTVAQKVGITISPTSAQVIEGQTKQFTATVSGATDTSVNWSVSGAGCSGLGCGTISSNGLYTAPDTAVTGVVVTATPAVDSSVSASATVTVIVPVVVTVSPASVIVAAGTQQKFLASVKGSTNTAVTWSVSGPGCSGSGCGTVSTAGVYTAPPSLPSQTTVIVKATSQAMSTASGSAVVSLVATNNSKLSGQYAFSFTGYDSNGSYLAAGSFTANGSGMITTGQEDVNTPLGPSSQVQLSGTYQVTTDDRGTMTINSALGTHTYTFALNELGTKGRFISFDQSDVRGSGVLKKQDSSAFDPSVFVDGYVLAFSGQDQLGGRAAALGLIFPTGSGFVSGVSMDLNDAGSVLPTFPPFSGSYTVDDTGRGTMTLNIPGLGFGIVDITFYVVSANEFFLVSSDPISQTGLIFGGSGESQSNTTFFDAATLSGESIFTMTGTNGSAGVDTIGEFTYDGISSLTGKFDENNGGNITVSGLLTASYSMEVTGRATLTVNTPTGQVIWNIYATGQNQGFILDATSAAAGIGQVFAEGNTPPFSNSNIFGTYFLGPDDPIVQTAPLTSGVASFDGSNAIGGQGSVTGAVDVSKPSALSPTQVLAGTYAVPGGPNNGRGSILFTSPAPASFAVWVIGSSEFVGLDLDSTTTQPTIWHFEQ